MRIFIYLLALLFLLTLTVHGQALNLDGQVLEANTTRRVPALNIKLIASRDLREADRITSTNREGLFKFVNLRRGRYLLEIRQGVTLLHREIVAVEGDMRKQINLRRR